MSTAATGGAVAAIAAAAKAAKDRDEEENLTKYNSDDLDGWEFKIVRSDLGRFGNREVFERLCREEARAGWEMVEKFDNSRIRFKRRVEKRAQDQHLDFDPYRTSMSSISGGAVAIIIGLVLLLGGLVAFFAIGYDFEISDPSRVWILVAVVAVGVVATVLALMKKRRQ
jgi:hypothetical protein